MLDVLDSPCCCYGDDDDEDNNDGDHLCILKAVLHCSTSAFEAHSLTTCEPPLSALVSLHFAYGPEEGQLTFEQYRDALTVSTALTDLHLIGDITCTVVIGANGFPDHELSTITLLSLRKLNGLTSSTT